LQTGELYNMLFKNGIDLQTKLIEYISNSRNLFIFSPYIKLSTLKSLIDKQENVKAVFVRWEAKDLILGSSDLEIYPYLKEKSITLYRNSRLHLKAYLDDSRKCFVATANISSRALNLPPYEDFNYEIGTIIEDITIEDRLYFRMIQSDSIVITDNIYKQLSDQLTERKIEISEKEEFDFQFDDQDQDFLISALPMTSSIEKLIELYGGMGLTTDTEFNCVLHDLALYKIPLGLSKTEFREKITAAFFSHRFVKGFLQNMESTGEIYFGTAKEWVHNNCADAPLPRKWEITTNIQILYRWIITLGNGKYKVDRPNYSERLFLQ